MAELFQMNLNVLVSRPILWTISMILSFPAYTKSKKYVSTLKNSPWANFSDSNCRGVRLWMLRPDMRLVPSKKINPQKLSEIFAIHQFVRSTPVGEMLPSPPPISRNVTHIIDTCTKRSNLVAALYLIDSHWGFTIESALRGNLSGIYLAPFSSGCVTLWSWVWSKGWEWMIKGCVGWKVRCKDHVSPLAFCCPLAVFE